jgi:hypothetical protein
LIATRQPANLIGWLVLLTGFIVALAVACSFYVAWYTVDPASVPGAPFALELMNGCWLLLVGVVLPRLLIIFPDGRLPSPRWRVVDWLQLLIAGMIVILLVTPGDLDSGTGIENPFGIAGLEDIGMFIYRFGLPLVVAAAVAGFLSLIVRFRRSRGPERSQLKWIAWAGAIFALGTLADAILPPIAPWSDPITYLVWVTGFVLLPVAIGIAVLRYRLYEIDRLISRTIAYGVVTVLLGLVFVGAVLALGTVLASFTAGDTLAVAGSTLAVAALFQPLRRRVQTAVDRRFDRDRYDGERLVAAFGERLRNQTDLRAVRDDLVDVIESSLHPDDIAVWLRGPVVSDG